MNSPTDSDYEKKAAFWGHGMWISALLVILPPMIGGVVTVLCMRNAFADLGNSGIGSPAALSGHISNVLQATLWGLIFSCVGIVCFVISIVRFLQYRSLLRKPDKP